MEIVSQFDGSSGCKIDEQKAWELFPFFLFQQRRDYKASAYTCIHTSHYNEQSVKSGKITGNLPSFDSSKWYQARRPFTLINLLLYAARL